MSQMTASRWQATRRHSWRESVKQNTPLLGHRNWIVVANAASPAQSGAGIHTILARGTYIDVVRIVPDAIASSGRVNATIYTDAELGFVNDAGAGGVSEYRKHLEDLLAGRSSCRTNRSSCGWMRWPLVSAR